MASPWSKLKDSSGYASALRHCEHRYLVELIFFFADFTSRLLRSSVAIADVARADIGASAEVALDAERAYPDVRSASSIALHVRRGGRRVCASTGWPIRKSPLTIRDRAVRARSCRSSPAPGRRPCRLRPVWWTASRQNRTTPGGVLPAWRDVRRQKSFR